MSMFHCAIKQGGLDVAFPLSKIFESDRVSFHYFRTLEEFIILSQRYHLNLAFIAGGSGVLKDIEMIGLMKNNVFLSIIPTVLYHPDPTEDILIAAYQNGVDDFIHGPWRSKLFEARLRMVSGRSQRDIAFNPSTALPGPGLIEREIDRLIKLEADFAVCYADIDDFKAYNDYYGYYYGDRMIYLTSRIIRDAVFDICHEGFVGHIGGDDFVFIIPPDRLEAVCRNIIKVFDALIPYRYADEDRERGTIQTKNRRGEMEVFPLMAISIAVLINRRNTFTHAGQMSHMLADLKKYAKSRSGSNFVVERRKRY